MWSLSPQTKNPMDCPVAYGFPSVFFFCLIFCPFIPTEFYFLSFLPLNCSIVTFSYVDDNVRCSGSFGRYSEEIPGCLRDRPRDVVNHMMNNLREPDPRSVKRVKKVAEGTFLVDGKVRVQFGDDNNYPHCDCSDWRHSRLPCKHFCLIFSCIPEWGWEKLSSLYRESPLLNLDEMALNPNAKHALPGEKADTPTDTLESDMATEDEEATVHQQTAPLPPRQRTKSKVLQIHCRTVMKEITNATYLIKDEAA